ncbi:hypothetical protein GCM10010222_72890 [Streptomyces tanashiensis]|nr:hypothetical protein GCM10010222_72890 [Streptomyces tanashiensis]
MALSFLQSLPEDEGELAAVDAVGERFGAGMRAGEGFHPCRVGLTAFGGAHSVAGCAERALRRMVWWLAGSSG